MSVLVFLLFAASTLASLSSSEHTPMCTEDEIHGTLFVVQESANETEFNVLETYLSTSSPLTAHQFTRIATVSHSSQVTLSSDGVSDLQHERVVETSTSVVTLTRDAVVIVASEDGQTILLPLDSFYCKPHRLYARNPDDTIYVLCSNKSRVLKLTKDSSSAYKLEEIKFDLTNRVDSPAVAFSDEQAVGVAVLKRYYYGHDTDGFYYNQIQVERNIEIETESVVCDDTYFFDPSCFDPADRLLPYNDTHLIIECVKHKKQFLLKILSNNCEDAGKTPLELPQGAIATAVGPDRDTFVVNNGTSVLVRRNVFKQSYECEAGQQITRFDYIDTNNLVLFTATDALSCHLGVVRNLSPLSVFEQILYFIEGPHLFIATSSSNTTMTVFDVENACRFQFDTASSISTPPGALLLFAFVEGPLTTTITPSATVTQSIMMTPTVTSHAVSSPSTSSIGTTTSPTIDKMDIVEGPPPTTITPSATVTQSIMMTPTVTSHAVSSPSTSSISTTTSPTIDKMDFTKHYMVALAALIISCIAVAVILTFFIVTLRRNYRQSKSRSSPESQSHSPPPQSPSIRSSTTSLNIGIQETVAHPPIPATSSLCSISWTNRSPWDPCLITPIPETRPLVECIIRQNLVPSELYWTVPVPETHSNYRCISTHTNTEV